jgi:replicative DNA helicase
MFDIEFENDILARSIRDESYLKKSSWLCAAHHFSTPEHGWVCEVIMDTWKKFGERANGRIFASRAREDFPDEDKRRTRLELVAKLLKRKPEGSKAALEELSKFVRATTLQIALEASADALEKGKLEDAEAALQKATRVNIGERDYSLVKWHEEFDERQAARRHEKEHPEEHKCIPTGIKRLDKYLVGGVRRGELALALGTTGRGKSIFLSNVVDSAVMHGYSAVYFALEMPARQVAMRHDALRTRMRYDQFKGYNFKPSELREIEVAMHRVRKRFKNKFRIISMPVRSADIRKLKAALQDLYDDEGFIPDLIALDSGDHVKPMAAMKEDIRVQHAEVYWGLKQWAEEEGKVLWSTTHAGRDWAWQIATAEATSESYDKARISDLIVSLNDPESRPGWGRKGRAVVSDEEEEEEETSTYTAPTSSKRLHMYIAKYRDGTSRTRIELDADFSRMLIEETDREERDLDGEAA